ncbi:hypothetical protein [Halomonas denitrificans]|nr:hypothetical protein [Halomonas denitrificans]
MSERSTAPGRSAERWQVAGLVLWRGGLAFVAAYAFYTGAWQLLRRLDWPPQLTIGSSIALGGFALLMASLVLERRAAARREGDLLDDRVRGGDD